ncbi:LysR substrate-binding domain-containing protein [Nonomuraea thailandensis]
MARQRRVRLSDLREETWIDGGHPDCLGPTAPLFEALGAAPRIGFWCDDWNSKQALVAAGAGVMLAPTLAHPAIGPGVVLRATIPPLPTRGLYVAVAVPPSRAPAADAMLGILTGLIAQPGFLARRTRR